MPRIVPIGPPIITKNNKKAFGTLDFFFSACLLSCHIKIKETQLQKTTNIKILLVMVIASGSDCVPSPITHAIKSDSPNKAENITSIILYHGSENTGVFNGNLSSYNITTYISDSEAV